MKAAHTKSGFTLIELLVVIAIIGVLVIISLVAYSTVGPKTRDSRRKQDLQTIVQALEIYYQANKKYPYQIPDPLGEWYKSNRPQPWIPGMVSNYIAELPIDPSSNGGDPFAGGTGYAYRTAQLGECNEPGDQHFVLVTRLQNGSDSEILSKKDVKFCNGNSFLTWYGFDPQTYVLTDP